MVWADHRWIKALVKEALCWDGMVRVFAWANNRRKASWLQLPQLRWLAQEVCSVAPEGVRGFFRTPGVLDGGSGIAKVV